MSKQRNSRHLCVNCKSRKALYRYRGQVRAASDHALCFACWQSALDMQRMCEAMDVLAA